MILNFNGTTPKAQGILENKVVIVSQSYLEASILFYR